MPIKYGKLIMLYNI